MPKENLLIAENQGLDVDDQKKNDISNFIKSCNNFQDFIKKLEKENLIWYFIGPLCKDENIKEQINSKWEKEFHKFEQSINETHKKFEESLLDENFLVYTIKDNDFKIRFENKEKPIEISTLLKASDEGKVYNLSLGKDSQITATKKGSERHYNFTGSSSCEMTINWQAKDSKGNNINCSMTVKIDSSGIKSVVNEPKFGDLKFTNPLSEETENKILESVKQNKEVFINGKTLYQAFANMGKGVGDQQVLAEEIFTKDLPQSPTPSSSGYSSPDSRRSSFSTESEIGDEESEITDEYIDDGYDQQEMHKDYERKYEQEGLKGVDETINEINKLAEQRNNLILERDSLRNEINEQQQAMLERDQKTEELDASVKSLIEKLEKSEELNQKIEKEGDTQISTLSEGKQILEKEVERLKVELEKKEKELDEKDRDIKQLELKVNVLEQSQKDKNARIEDLINQLKDKESEIQSINKITEELQKKLDQGEIELSKLRAENTELINNTKKILVEGSEDNHEKQLVEELMEEKEKNNTSAKEMKLLSQEFNELQRKNEDLEKKIRQLEPGRPLADELSEVTTKVATSTQTEVEYGSRVISMEQKDQGTQAKNAGVDASSSTDQKDTKEMEVQTDVQMSNLRDLYDKEGEYVKTEFSDPNVVPAKTPEQPTPSKR